MTVTIFPHLREIPLFQPDDSPDVLPQSVVALRAAIADANAVLFSVPEYAHSLPGAFKNALDWLVGGTECTGKPVALWNASPRSIYAHAAAREVLVTLGARFLEEASVTVSLGSEDRTAEQLAADPSIATPLTAALHRLAELLDDSRATVSQPVGPAVPGWTPRPHPEPRSFEGRYCRLEPIDVEAHSEALYAVLCDPANNALWTYLLRDRLDNLSDWQQRLSGYAASGDPLYFTILDETNRPAGLTSYLRIAPEHGLIEVGNIHLSPSLQMTRAATEFQYLLLRHAFDDLGYRRYEWKCDSLNAPSRRAALRLGFQFEGIFRKAIVYKGRSRDTAWFSITDDEWPAVRTALEAWLAPENFDENRRQVRSLASFRLSAQ